MERDKYFGIYSSTPQDCLLPIHNFRTLEMYKEKDRVFWETPEPDRRRVSSILHIFLFVWILHVLAGSSINMEFANFIEMGKDLGLQGQELLEFAKEREICVRQEKQYLEDRERDEGKERGNTKRK